MAGLKSGTSASTVGVSTDLGRFLVQDDSSQDGINDNTSGMASGGKQGEYRVGASGS